ncbi:MAG: HD-GYP domain-containing protein [Thermoanaerobaculia bacterium]
MPAERPATPGTAGRGYRWREESARFLLGAAIGLLCAGLNFLPSEIGERLGLDQLSAGAVLAGTIYGVPGTLGFVACEELLRLAVLGRPSVLQAISAWLLLGFAGHILFRLRGDTGRRLPNLRSYLLLLGGSATVSVVASSALVSAYFPAVTVRAVALWFAAMLSSIVLLVPPALVLWPHRLWRWRTPIAAELPRRPSSTADASPGSRLQGDSSGAIPIVRDRAVLGDAGLVVLWVTTVHLMVLLSGEGRSPLSHWIFLLYGLPILFASYRGGLKGGILSGTAVSASLLATSLTGFAPGDWHLSMVDLQGGVVLFSVLGAVAGAMRNHELQLTAKLERSNRVLRQDLERVLSALRSAMEAKDQYTEGHLRRVCDFAVAVGRRMNLSEHDLERLEIASLLHDVGKIGIADSILRKPGPLDPRERQLMQRHPEIGARILENVNGLEDAATMVRHHQERYDGRLEGDFPGYPLGLSGDRIPLGARIIAVVDAFDAMTSDRPYRDSIGFERARASLRAEAGRQFDPEVVEVFLSLLSEQGWSSGLVEERE